LVVVGGRISLRFGWLKLEVKTYVDHLKALLDLSASGVYMEDTLVKNLNETIQYLRLQEDENRNLKDKISLLEAELSQLKEQTSYVLDEGNFHENIKTLPDGRVVVLGINDLEKKNEEAVHDATNYFSKKCPYCERDLFKTNIRDKKEVDHFIPISKGGQNVPWNILPSCKGCNRKKRDKMPNVFLDKAIYDRCFKYRNYSRLI
jgi:hypothetical protein